MVQLEEVKRRDRISLGRAFVVVGVILMGLLGYLAMFVVGFGDCFGDDATCQQGHSEAAAVIGFLPYLGAFVVVMATLALRYRVAQVVLLAIGIATIAFPFVGPKDHGLVVPFVHVPVWLLGTSLLAEIPAAVVLMLGAVLLLVTARQSRPAPSS